MPNSTAIAGVHGPGPEEALQQTLPPLRWLLQPDAERFAHPAERELARLLTFYEVRWAYEPTTFAVRWDAEGNPEEFVTPDFYLPDHDRYLELTTMRQRLVTRKNRKFRLLRQNYPNVTVRILYLRDVERLQDAFGPLASERRVRIRATLYDEHELDERVAEMAKELVKISLVKPGEENSPRPLILGMGEGASQLVVALSKKIGDLGFAIDRDWIELTTIASQPSGARARVLRPPIAPLAGRPVVIVQEVLSTGLSAAFVERWLRKQGAGPIGVCALLDREAARILDVSVACRGFKAPDVSLAGFGLARWREYRNLPFIAEVKPTD